MQNPKSPETQNQEIQSTLKRAGFPWVEARVYRDDAVSGRKIRKRPGFMRMLHDIESGLLKIDLILVDMIERFGRMEELESIRRNLRNRQGVLVLTADSNFADPTSVSGQALGIVDNIRSTQAAREKAHTVCRGKRYAATEGHWPGGPAPLGYKLESVMKEGEGPQEVDYRRLVVDPETAPLVKEAFDLAATKGFGAMRIAKHFNAQPQLVERFGRFNGNTIHRILANPIYKGLLRWGYLTTGIVEDCRVVKRNPADQVTEVPNFCEPLVSAEVFEAVQLQRRVRAKQNKSIRKSELPADKKIAPLVHGLVLKFPLSGLVRCGHCGASMRPMTSGRTSKAGRHYTYYTCPNHIGGGCPNGAHIHEPWLWSEVVQKLQQHLLPACGEVEAVPEWLAPLVEEIRAQWSALRQADQDATPALRQEQKDLAANISGWSQSLANCQLGSQVRQMIEQQCQQAIARRQEIDGELAQLEDQAALVEKLLDPRQVLVILQKLKDILSSENPTLVNLELSRHIDRIDTFSDGRVVMRTCRLGVFDGLTQWMDQPQTPAQRPNTTGNNPEVQQVTPRRRAQHRVADLTSPAGDYATDAAMAATDPQRFANLAERWFWIDEFIRVPDKCWSEQHAAEVAAKKAEDPRHWTFGRLAEHFGKSTPTIRQALRIALNIPTGPLSVDRKYTAKRIEDHRQIAEEALVMFEQNMTAKAIAVKLNLSRATIDKGLDYAWRKRYGQDRPDGRQRNRGPHSPPAPLTTPPPAVPPTEP